MATTYPPATFRQIRSRQPMSRHDVICLHTMVGTHDAAGNVARAELFYDQVTMLAQLGHMPPPEG